MFTRTPPAAANQVRSPQQRLGRGIGLPQFLMRLLPCRSPEASRQNIILMEGQIYIDPGLLLGALFSLYWYTNYYHGLLSIDAVFRYVRDFSATAFLSSLSRPAWSRNLDKALHQCGRRLPEDWRGTKISVFCAASFTTSPELINLNQWRGISFPEDRTDA